MLSNRLQYLTKKNKRFLSKDSSHKSSRREEKGCFNYKKIGHFIAECPDLQKDKSKEKFKKPIFKSNKFKKQIKKSLMATWESILRSICPSERSLKVRTSGERSESFALPKRFAVATLTGSLSPRAKLRSRLLVISRRLFRHPRSRSAPAKIS